MKKLRRWSSFCFLTCLATTTAVHAAPGELDSTFGTAGRVFFQPAELGDVSISAIDLTLQSDGKIIAVAGTPTLITKQYRDNVIARFNTDGTLDTTFNRVGYKLFSLNAGSSTAASVLQQSDGKLIVTGATEATLGDRDFVAYRLNADGSFDPTFGTGGSTIVSFGTGDESPLKAVLQTNGSIVLAGVTASTANGDFAVARLTSTGAIDTSFGTQGKVTIDSLIGAVDSVASMLVQPDGKLVIAGYAGPPATARPFVVRLNADGSLDPAFADNGRALLPPLAPPLQGAAINTVAQQSDGRLVLGGTIFNQTGQQTAAIALLATNGTLDSPLTVLDLGGQAAIPSNVQGVFIQPNGALLVTGFTSRGPAAFLTRFSSFGTVDATFGEGGTAFIDGGQPDRLNNIVGFRIGRQSDGRIVVLGTSALTAPVGQEVTTNRTLFLARLGADTASSAGTIGIGPLAPSSVALDTLNEGTTLSIPIVRSGGRSGAVSVDYSLVPVTATAGVDYSLASGTLTWANGEIGAKNIVTGLIADGLYESTNEEFRVVLSNLTGGATGGMTTRNVFIRNASGTAAVPTVTLNRTAIARAGDSGSTFALIPWSTSGAVPASSFISYSVFAGTAVAGQDYTAVNGTIPLVATTGTIQIPLVDDSVDEPAKTFTVTLNSPSGVVIGNGSTAITLIDNDAPSIIEMRETARTVAEASTSIALVVTRTAHNDGALTIDFATQNGTASGGANGADFVAATGTLSWAPGDYASKQINLTLTPDTTQESSETFSVVLSNPGGGAVLGQSTATVSITDDDVPPNPGGGGTGGGGGGGGGGALSLWMLLALAAVSCARLASRAKT